MVSNVSPLLLLLLLETFPPSLHRNFSALPTIVMIIPSEHKKLPSASASPRAQHVRPILPLGPLHQRPPGHILQHTHRPLHPRQPHAHPQLPGLRIRNPRRQHRRCLVRLPRRKSMFCGALVVRSFFFHCCVLPCGLCHDVCSGFR